MRVPRILHQDTKPNKLVLVQNFQADYNYSVSQEQATVVLLHEHMLISLDLARSNICELRFLFQSACLNCVLEAPSKSPTADAVVC